VPSVLPSKDNPHAGTFRGEWSDDTALPFKRLLTFSDGDALTQARAANRAEWKAKRGKFDSWVGEYTAVGHSLGGVLFAADTMCGINDSVHNVHGPFYVSGRRFMRNLAVGTATALTVRKPNLLYA
jgi:prophage tail gpP-like protein